MSWVAECAALALCLAAGAAQARDLHVLVVGQSISSNCNEHVYGPVPGVDQVGRDGVEKPASDPLEWADCRKGSMWIPLGKALIDAKVADRVVFMPVGVEGTRVADWLDGGRAYGKLQAALRVAKARNLRFDYALWHQGSADQATSKDDYRAALSKVLNGISIQVPVDRWIVAQHSSCFGHSAPQIAEAQREVGKNHVLRRFAGPDTNALGPAYRVDGCHLNRAGQEEMARRWQQSMAEAAQVSEHFEKEALLYYFKWDLAGWFRPSASTPDPHVAVAPTRVPVLTAPSKPEGPMTRLSRGESVAWVR